jgi:hypothetical protein
MLLEETGTVKVAAELAGLGIGAIYRLRKLEAGFRERMEAAIVKGTARLASESSRPHLPTAGAAGPSLSPEGRGESEGLVPRRGKGGLVRLVSAGQRWWEPERHDEIFLLGLRGTGNVEAWARAAGFTARTAYSQMKKRPDLAALCEQAMKDAKPRLEDLLVEYAGRWSLPAAGEAFEGEPLDERDVDRALRTLAYWGRSGRWRAAAGQPSGTGGAARYGHPQGPVKE